MGPLTRLGPRAAALALLAGLSCDDIESDASELALAIPGAGLTPSSGGSAQGGEAARGGEGGAGAPTCPTESIASAVAVGWNHSMLLDEYAQAFSWGANGSGQLGRGDTEQHPRAASVHGAGPGWVKLVGGSRHSCGIRTDGTLWCWGVNVHGQLGTGDTTDRNEPAQVGDASDWADVACGGLHSCGLRQDGSRWCWGANPVGQLGLGEVMGDQHVPMHPDDDGAWVALAAKTRHTCGLRADGSLFCWGDNSDGQIGVGDREPRRSPVQVGLGSTWAKVRAGALHTLAINDRGELYAWGANDAGQLGLGDRVPRLTPSRVGEQSDWQLVSGGFSHSCGLKGGNQLYCWGDNSLGQLGLADPSSRLFPVRVSDLLYQDMHLGEKHTCALSADRKARCFGADDWGQRGTGAQAFEQAPICFE